MRIAYIFPLKSQCYMSSFYSIFLWQSVVANTFCHITNYSQQIILFYNIVCLYKGYINNYRGAIGLTFVMAEHM